MFAFPTVLFPLQLIFNGRLSDFTFFLEFLLEKEMAAHSSVQWRIPWTEEPGGAAIYGAAKSQMQLSNTHTHTHTHTNRTYVIIKMQKGILY